MMNHELCLNQTWVDALDTNQNSILATGALAALAYYGPNVVLFLVIHFAGFGLKRGARIIKRIPILLLLSAVSPFMFSRKTDFGAINRPILRFSRKWTLVNLLLTTIQALLIPQLAIKTGSN